MKKNIILAVLALFFTACSVPLEYRIYQTNFSGNPQNSESLFNSEYSKIQNADPGSLNALCASYTLTWEFDKLRYCADVMTKKASSVVHRQMAYYHSASYYLYTGDYEKSLSEVGKVYEIEQPQYALSFWELEAKALINLNRTADIQAMIEKINNFSITIWLGLLDVEAGAVGRERRSTATRIYLYNNQPSEARIRLEQELPDKSLSQHVFEGVFNFLNVAPARAAEGVLKHVGPQIDVKAFEYMVKVGQYFTLGELFLKEKRYGEAIQSFRFILNDPRSKNVKFFYMPSLLYASIAYGAKGDQKSAQLFWDLFAYELNKQSSKGVIKLFADQLRRDVPAINYANAGQVCRRWNEAFKSQMVTCK